MSRSPTEPPPGPPHPEVYPGEIQFGRGAGWGWTAVFLLLLAVPAFLGGPVKRGRELAAAVAGKGSGKPIAERLREFDAGVASADFTNGPREVTQQFLTAVLGRGNDRVVTGRDGWLFYRPELQALSGYGPLDPEPHSVSRDPALLDWESPLEPIREFAAQLKERGVRLWLLPVPMKPSIYPEHLTGETAAEPLRHRRTGEFFAALGEAGVRVVDVAADLMRAKVEDHEKGPVYLKDDTHWTTRGMELAAGRLAGEIREEPWWSAPVAGEWPVQRMGSAPGHGDLVEKLGLRNPDKWAAPREEPLAVVSLPQGVESEVDRDSPVVLIGDSFVNIFDDASLGFGRPDGAARTQGGLAWHLAGRLGMPLDVHAVNGEGASGVRHWLGQRGESVLRSKKLVVWVIAERDLFLSRSVAKANQVRWDRVEIAKDAAEGTGEPATPEAGGPLVVEAVAVEKAELPDLRRANYASALYAVRYEVRKVLSGSLPPGEVEVAHWHFRNRELQPSAAVEVGQTYRLNLEKWGRRKDLETLNMSQIDFEIPGWWAETPEMVP